MVKKTLILPLLLIAMLKIDAQQYPVRFTLKTIAGFNGPDNVPFWMRSNQFGSVAPAGASIGLTGTIQKDYEPAKSKKDRLGIFC